MTSNTASTIAAPRKTPAPTSGKPNRVQPSSPRTMTKGMDGEIAPAGEQHTPKPPSKLDQLAAFLTRAAGATIAEMMAATGWQAHSVRGALAGALTKTRGLTITSQKAEGVRTYRAGAAVLSDASSETAR